MIRIVALVAARDEADRVGATVKALRTIDGLAEVVVVDDGSTDDTAAAALSAGAAVLRLDRSRGKGRALEGALGRLPAPDVWLLADADLAESAASLGDVMAPVLAGDADLAVGTFPPGQAGGFGLVKGTAAWAIKVLTGLEVREPLSGQRAITAEALEAVRPLARGFGLETAMTIDAARAGLRVVEIPAELSHRATHRDARGFAHRGRQGWNILAAVLPRALGLR
jgi:glycosyl transferase family 2